MNMKPRMHVLMAQQFKDHTMLLDLFKTTAHIKQLVQDGEMQDAPLSKALRGGMMYEIFYEPSTRTRFSFWAAATMLGMQVCASESAGQFSSAIKGETLEHTVRVLAGQNVHVIVIRHPETGVAQRAAAVVDKYYPRKVSVVNAGDGRGQHPTQALLDVYTIWEKLGRVDDLTVLIGGDLLNGRTCRSLAYLLSKFHNIHLILMSPPELQMGDDIIAHLNEAGVEWRIETDLPSTLPLADVVYWTRVQRERLQEPSRYIALRDAFHIGKEEADRMKDTAILLHPLPIAGEISPEVDDHPRAAYFNQANNGQFVRAALLMHVFGVTA